MSKRSPKETCCSFEQECCLESLVAVDGRGQMVLSKELRKKAGINPGDKFAVATWKKDGRVCCITLIKTDEFSGMVKNILGPLVQKLSTK